MKLKWISAISILAMLGTGSIAAIPAIINNSNNINNQSNSINQIIETDNIKHSSNVQVVNTVDQITIDNLNVSSTNESIAIVKNSGIQEIYVWGNNSSGQLGLGDIEKRIVPTLLPASQLGNYSFIKEIYIKNHAATAIVQVENVEKIFVWGFNENGQLGIGNFINQSTPVLFDTKQFGDLYYIKEFSIAREDSITSTNLVSYAIVIDNNEKEKIFVWGSNNFGQLGLGDKANRSSPTLFDTTLFGLSYRKIVKIAIRSNHSVALIENLDNSRSFYLWGKNDRFQCSPTVADSIPSPTKYTFNTSSATIKDVGLGLDATYLILTRNGIDELYLWGSSDNGRLMTNTTDLKTPTITNSLIGNPTEIVYIGLMNYCYAVVKINGVDQVYVWGQNDIGVAGSGNFGIITTPFKFDMSSIGSPLQIYDWSYNNSDRWDTHRYAYVRTRAGDGLYVWGENTNGQLGLGDIANKNIPTLVPASDLDLNGYKIKRISTSKLNTSVVLEAGTNNLSYVTGSNVTGQLGIGNLTQQNKFTQFLPTTYTKFVPKTVPRPNETSSEALNLINSNNNVIDALNEYVQILHLPADATLSIDYGATISDYQNGILNLAITTDKYNDLMIKDTIVATKTFNVIIEGFKKVTDISTNPVVAIPRDANNETVDDIYERLAFNTRVIDRKLLSFYFELSSIPAAATIHLYRTSFDNKTEATFTLTSDQVYANNGLLIIQKYVKTDLLLKLITPFDLALVVSLSVVGGVLLISAIITTLLMWKFSKKEIDVSDYKKY